MIHLAYGVASNFWTLWALSGCTIAICLSFKRASNNKTLKTLLKSPLTPISRKSAIHLCQNRKYCHILSQLWSQFEFQTRNTLRMFSRKLIKFCKCCDISKWKRMKIKKFLSWPRNSQKSTTTLSKNKFFKLKYAILFGETEENLRKIPLTFCLKNIYINKENLTKLTQR